MNYHSAHCRIDASALVNRFGFPPLVKGETLQEFKRELSRYIGVFGSKDGIHWHDVWDHLIASWRLNRYTEMKAIFCKSPPDSSSRVFARTFGGFATHMRRSDPIHARADFQNEDDIVDALFWADAEGKDIMLPLNCLIAQARADQLRISERLFDHYRNGCNIIDGEWEEIK